MANEIQIIMTSDASKVIADQAKYIASLEKTNKQLAEMGKLGASSAKQAESGLKGIAAAMANDCRRGSGPKGWPTSTAGPEYSVSDSGTERACRR